MDMAEASRGKLPRPPAAGGQVRQEEVNRKSQWSDLIFLSASAVALLADLGTDGLLCAEYWRSGERGRALATLLLVAAPMLVVQAFSLRWHIADRSASLYHWASHVCLAGLFHRYITLVNWILSREGCDGQRLQQWRCRLCDLTLLNLFRSLLQSAPQVALQAYFCIASEQHSYVRTTSLAVSLLCAVWAGPAYGQRVLRWSPASAAARLPSLLLWSAWYCCMLVARLAAIVLFAVVFGLWTLVPLGIHWAAMTVWIISHKTDFCPTKLEELLYNIVVGFIYCFCYFNLREGRTRYRLMTFYTLMVTQNLASLFLFMLVSEVARQRKVWAVLATVCIVAGTIIGLCSMLLYYRWFHPGGPIKWNNVVEDDMELNNKEPSAPAARPPDRPVTTADHRGRTLKVGASQAHTVPKLGVSQEVLSQLEMGNTDKKFLLEHWIARSGTPTFVSAPIGNNSMDVTGVEFHTIENTPQSGNTMSTDSVVSKSKNINKKKICSPTELNLKLSSIEHMESSIDELTSSNLTLQKRRGICSSDELKGDLEQLDIDAERSKKEKSQSVGHGSEISQDTDSSNKKTSSDSIDMDLELSFSDINSSDINEFNENIVQKLCLSTLKNIKVGNQDADIQNIQRIALDILKEMYAKKGKHSKVKARDILAGSKRELETPSEVLSVHDYENICAVNIAREAWGLRSWNNYSDIESRRHDGSVGHDPRRDTLTSASSEISSCLSHELRQQLMCAAAPPVPRRLAPTYSNVFVKLDPPTLQYADQQDEADCYTFLAKPCLIDGSVTNHLEPIIEEIDDFGDVEPPSKPRLNSESSLVAIIDEIRKCTTSNSPRNVYHRRENMWDSPQMNSPAKIETSLKRALWKEPSKFNSSNILESLQEKENNTLEFNHGKFSPCKVPVSDETLAVTTANKAELGSGGKNTRRNQKVTNLKSEIKKNIAKGEEIHDLSNKDVDFLWQLVSDNALPLQLTSTEDLAASQITSSLQSLILKDCVPAPIANSGQKSNAKKIARNRPRRKFSLLREHFEPKSAKVGDEALYRRFERKKSLPDGNAVFNVRFQNELSREPSSGRNKSSGELNGVPASPSEVTPAAASWGRCSPRNIKEKRSLFLKQVLSPPKFNTKTKHKT